MFNAAKPSELKFEVENSQLIAGCSKQLTQAMTLSDLGCRILSDGVVELAGNMPSSIDGRHYLPIPNLSKNAAKLRLSPFAILCDRYKADDATANFGPEWYGPDYEENNDAKDDAAEQAAFDIVKESTHGGVDPFWLMAFNYAHLENGFIRPVFGDSVVAAANARAPKDLKAFAPVWAESVAIWVEMVKIGGVSRLVHRGYLELVDDGGLKLAGEYGLLFPPTYDPAFVPKPGRDGYMIHAKVPSAVSQYAGVVPDGYMLSFTNAYDRLNFDSQAMQYGYQGARAVVLKTDNAAVYTDETGKQGAGDGRKSPWTRFIGDVKNKFGKMFTFLMMRMGSRDDLIFHDLTAKVDYPATLNARVRDFEEIRMLKRMPAARIYAAESAGMNSNRFELELDSYWGADIPAFVNNVFGPVNRCLQMFEPFKDLMTRRSGIRIAPNVKNVINEKNRMNALLQQLSAGVLTINEVRKKLHRDLDPLPEVAEVAKDDKAESDKEDDVQSRQPAKKR